MTNNDDMREQLQRVESTVNGLAERVEGLEVKVIELTTKVDQLPTQADFERMTNKVSILVGEAKDDSKKAAEGYKATLDRIERDLGKMNRKVRTTPRSR